MRSRRRDPPPLRAYPIERVLIIVDHPLSSGEWVALGHLVTALRRSRAANDG